LKAIFIKLNMPCSCDKVILLHVS